MVTDMRYLLSIILCLTAICAWADISPQFIGAVTSGGEATSSVVGLWPLDDNTTGTAVISTIGPNGTLYGVTNSSEISTSDAVSGKAMAFSVSSGHYGSIPIPDFSVWSSHFTIEFDIKGTSNYNTGNVYAIMIGPVSGDQIFRIFNNEGTFKVNSSINGGNDAIAIKVLSSNTDWQTWTHVIIDYNVSIGTIKTKWGADTVRTFISADTSWGYTPTRINVAYSGYVQSGGFILDNLKMTAGGVL